MGLAQSGAVELGHARHSTYALAMDAAVLAVTAAPNTRAEGGFTPLHEAALNNPDPAAVAALIAGGADPGARDEAGMTPFDYAKDNEALQGTDVYWRLNEARSEGGRPPIRRADRRGRFAHVSSNDLAVHILGLPRCFHTTRKPQDTDTSQLFLARLSHARKWESRGP